MQLIAILFITLLTLSYFIYGKWVAKQLAPDDQSVTPAHRFKDGEDFLPTKAFYLFGQHFSAIAAAGPIAGPIAACLMFGWLPCLLWILLGVVLIGAVHDLTTLMASVKHDAKSIAEVAKDHISTTAGKAFTFFIWLALIYVIVAFTDITASTFVSRSEELESAKINFNPGGAVAAASIFYLLLSLILGITDKFLRPQIWFTTLIFVPLTFTVAWMGTKFSHLFLFDVKVWALLIIIYCALSSVAPVWLLLQPRGYLGGFILYFVLIVGVVGIFGGGYEVKQPIFTGFNTGASLGQLFPFLFVTIACGACSGFHGLVCSGTTSKQIDKESHCRPIGYGAMLAEAFVAFIALSTVMIMEPDSVKGLKPGTIYGNGIGEYLSIIIGRENLNLAVTLGAMAFSTFVFDTLDVATRLGRYLIQELTGRQTKTTAAVGTLLTVGVPAFILYTSPDGGWAKFWTLFGASNQLLAALSLLSVTLWLHQARKRIFFTLIPMTIVLCITVYALFILAKVNWEASQGIDASLFNSAVSILLILLALYICMQAIYRVKKDGLKKI